MLRTLIMAVKSKLKDEKGQAIFEMIVFLPFIILLFTLIVTVGNSINGSINQQKATRSYFYYVLAGDSIGAPTEDLLKMGANGMNHVGFYAFGWKEKDKGKVAYSTCFKMNKFLGSNGNEDCDNPEDGATTSDFIRVFTAYGICTGNLEANNTGFDLIRRNGYISGCSIQ